MRKSEVSNFQKQIDASRQTSENVIVRKRLLPEKKRCAERGMCGAEQHAVMRSVLLQSADGGEEVAGRSGVGR